MRITIDGASRTPTWEHLQACVRDMLDNEEGVFVRIARPYGGCNYRATGTYAIEFLPLPSGDIISIVLEVEPS